MRNTSKLNWLKDKEREFRKTGKLDISGEMLENLSFIGSRPTMKTLDLSFTSIKSLEGLPPQPKLEYLILDGSTIESFKNGESISSISKISIRNTPISKIPNYKISLLLICDKNLRIIDDRIIPSKLKQKAEKYPPICRKLVNQGWIAEYPCPSESELIDICFRFGLSYQEETQNKNMNSFNEVPLFEEKDIDEMISKYSSKHKKMLERAKEKLENYDEITTNPYDSNYNTSVNLDITSGSSSVNTNTNTDFTEEIYTFNAENYQDSIPPNEEEERMESFISYNPNLLSFRVSEIIKKYGFDIDDDGDRIEAIISTLSHIFQIAEGKDIDFPHVLMDGNAIALDDDFEEDEEESFLSEDFNISPKKPRTNVTFDFSNQPNAHLSFQPPQNTNSEYKDSNDVIQIESSDHLLNEYNEEEENKIDGNIKFDQNEEDEDITGKEKDIGQRKEELDSDSINSISAIDGVGQINDSLIQQGLILDNDKNENGIEQIIEEEEEVNSGVFNFKDNSLSNAEEEEVNSGVFNFKDNSLSNAEEEEIKNGLSDIKDNLINNDEEEEIKNSLSDIKDNSLNNEEEEIKNGIFDFKDNSPSNAEEEEIKSGSFNFKDNSLSNAEEEEIKNGLSDIKDNSLNNEEEEIKDGIFDFKDNSLNNEEESIDGIFDFKENSNSNAEEEEITNDNDDELIIPISKSEEEENE